VQTFRKRRAGLSATAGLSCLYSAQVTVHCLHFTHLSKFLSMSDDDEKKTCRNSVKITTDSDSNIKHAPVFLLGIPLLSPHPHPGIDATVCLCANISKSYERILVMFPWKNDLVLGQID